MSSSIKIADYASLEDFESTIRQYRPEFHRYCARMAGSVVDGEDILQQSLIKAYAALTRGDQVQKIKPWLYQIVHNSALDFLKRQKKEIATEQNAINREFSIDLVELPLMIRDNLRLLLLLPPLQRSVLILRELFGHTASEVAEIIDSSTTAVKSALYRGRENIRKQKDLTEFNTSSIDIEQKKQLEAYISLFNDRKFDQLRQLLTEEVELDLVDKSRRQGRVPVGNYFSNYDKQNNWRLELGIVEGKHAILVFETSNSNKQPAYFILLSFNTSRLCFIKDFRYARYIMESAMCKLL